MFDGQNVFDQPVKNDIRIYDNTRKNGAGQGDNYTIVACFIIHTSKKFTS